MIRIYFSRVSRNLITGIPARIYVSRQIFISGHIWLADFRIYRQFLNYDMNHIWMRRTKIFLPRLCTFVNVWQMKLCTYFIWMSENIKHSAILPICRGYDTGNTGPGQRSTKKKILISINPLLENYWTANQNYRLLDQL